MNKDKALKIFEPFETILFDYGGIFFNLDFQKTVNEFTRLGCKTEFSEIFSKHNQIQLFNLFETGKITPSEFIDELKTLLHLPNSSEAQMKKAWCAMLLDIPKERVELLRELKKNKKIYMLSNINQIHEDFALEYISKHEYLKEFYSLFDHVYFSHQIGLRKPHPEVFEYVCAKSKLDQKSTIFIDDSIQHIEGAKKAGLATYHLDPSNSFIV